MKQFIKQNSIFLGLCLIFLIVLGVVLLLVPKADLHLWLNQYHSPAADTFFIGCSSVAELVPYAVVILLLFYKAGWSVFLFANLIISGFVGQGFKYLFNTPRPLTYFTEHLPDIQLQLADGVEMSRYYSFPSGHAITFFVLFFTLCLITTEFLAGKKLQRPRLISSLAQIILFIFVLLGCYSRIYLSQHFAEDIWGGLVVGLLVSMLFCVAFLRFSDKKWWNWHFFAKKTQKNLVD